MNYAQINKIDVAQGVGCRVSVFFQGCRGFMVDGKLSHCKDCFNSEIWSFSDGKLFDNEAKKELFEYLSKPYIKGLSVLGGEPLQQGQELVDLLKEVKETFKDKDIWLWTGYYIDGREELDDIQKEILSLCDYVVDGRFEEDKKDLTLKFRGSSNQTIWEMNSQGIFIKSKLNE